MRLVIVGASSGIGRDIQPILRACGHEVTPLRRPDDAMIPDCHALLLCQRYRGAGDEWSGEIMASMTKTKALCEWAGEHWTEGGAIVVMASVAGVSVEDEQPVSYHACKAALIEMVKYYAVTLGPQNIRINAILPGLTIKPEARPFYDANPDLEATYADITPMGRTCTVADLGFEVDHLIDPRCYITGQTIVVDGGISLRSQWAVARRVTPSLRELNVTQRRAERC